MTQEETALLDCLAHKDHLVYQNPPVHLAHQVWLDPLECLVREDLLD